MVHLVKIQIEHIDCGFVVNHMHVINTHLAMQTDKIGRTSNFNAERCGFEAHSGQKVCLQNGL